MLNGKEFCCIPHLKKLVYVFELEVAAMSNFKVWPCGESSILLNKRQEEQATRTEQMRRNKQLSKELRKIELKTELEKHGLEISADSFRIAESYINNSKCVSTLSQSVELIRHAHIVRQHVDYYYNKLMDIAYVKLKVNFHHNPKDFADFWQEEKLSTEEGALEIFMQAKKKGTLTEIRRCECGEPLFDAKELKELEKGIYKRESR